MENERFDFPRGRTAKLRDELTGALIGLARATDNNTETSTDTWRIMIEGLLAADVNTDFDEETLREEIDRVHAEKARLVPDCAVCTSPCGRTNDCDMALLRNEPENIRALKARILSGARDMAACAHHAMAPGYADEEMNFFFARALFAVGEDWNTDELRSIVRELEEKRLRFMAW